MQTPLLTLEMPALGQLEISLRFDAYEGRPQDSLLIIQKFVRKMKGSKH